MTRKLVKIIFVLIICSLMGVASKAATSQKKVKEYVKKADQYSKQKYKKYIAVTYINKAIRIQPNDINLYYKRAQIFGRVGLYRYAIKAFTPFVKRKKFSHAVRFRADCFLALGMYQQAVQDYTSFLRQAPDDGKVWSYLAETYAIMGKSNLALSAIKKGLATGSHWTGRLKKLQSKIIQGEPIVPHKALSN